MLCLEQILFGLPYQIHQARLYPFIILLWWFDSALLGRRWEWNWTGYPIPTSCFSIVWNRSNLLLWLQEKFTCFDEHVHLNADLESYKSICSSVHVNFYRSQSRSTVFIHLSRDWGWNVFGPGFALSIDWMYSFTPTSWTDNCDSSKCLLKGTGIALYFPPWCPFNLKLF